ncbi:uncharacterized protein Triagg1_8804 [Trichoderma aggressivum f. europaeum]|uniref:Glutaredoxin domain-containing protein n=1 Tax=Trichoderma aggressivum f. europaeum TaxID=173218 RepID=A0AAE1I9N8_9HYPO|nr:hypothetical protein Triagg1_8804 [Trichoderma aggressivum f. europaeum]
MLSLILVFFYLLFCSIFGVYAMPAGKAGSHHFKRLEHLHMRVHSLRLSRPINVKMDEPVQSPGSWSESRLEEGLLYKDVESEEEVLLESFPDELSTDPPPNATLELCLFVKRSPRHRTTEERARASTTYTNLPVKMPSPRRMRLLMVAVVITVVVMLFYSSGMEPEADAALKGFYEKTKEAMERGTARGQAVINSQTGQRAGHIPADRDGDGDIDDDDRVASQELQERLQAVAQEAKDKANEKSPKPDIPSRIVGVGSSAEGQAKKGQVKVGGGSDVGDRVKTDVTKEETREEHEAEVEINSILKKSPVIIFSKSYCPYSKRAKGILLEKYSITPEPFVVELDEHPLGPHLQDYLLKKTGRRTVPNILINGVSIGGSDDIVALDNEDKLVGKVRDLGQARIEISPRFTKGEHQ